MDKLNTATQFASQHKFIILLAIKSISIVTPHNLNQKQSV